MDLGHSLVSQTSPLTKSIADMWNQYNRNNFQRQEIEQNWTAFFSFTIILHSLPLTTDKADGIDCICLSAFYVSLKQLWGRVVGLQTVSSHENLRSNDSRRLYDANVLLDVRRTADASRLSQGFRAKEPSVDPTRQMNMSVFARKSSLWIGAQISENTTRSWAIAEGPRDASCQLKSCQLPSNSAENSCTTSPKQIEVMKLEG